MVQAREEARLLAHPFIGTEHILLGLLRVREGVAAEALEQLDISMEAARSAVMGILGDLGEGTSPESPPFTPRAKKVLELALREALELGHNYIGTEHLLLGLVGEEEGVGARVLISLGTDPSSVRHTVLWLLAARSAGAPGKPGKQRARVSRPLKARMVTCSFCGRRPPETGRVVAGAAATICEHCIEEWHARMGGRRQGSSSSRAQLVNPADSGVGDLPEQPDE